MAQGAGIAYLTAYIGADTVAFRNGMAQVRRDLMDIGGIASGLQDIGKTLTYTITAPIVGAMGVAVSQFAEFEAEMRNIAAISPLVAQDFEGISDTVRRMGQEFRVGADGMAQALYTVQSAGFGLNDVNEALTVTEQSAKLAEAGLSSIIPTTNALVGSLLAYGEGADMAQYHSDVLAQTVALGVGSMEGLLTTMSSSLPQAAALGISFDDLGSTLAFMTQQGFNWARAGTGVGNMFNKLITPSEALKAIYEDLGAGSGQELIEMFGGLGGALQEIYNIVGDDPEKIRKLFPDDRGFRIALGIFENFDRYTSLLADFDATLDGATDSQRQQQMQSFSYKFDVMKSSIENFLIAVGGAVAPVLEPLVEGIADLFQTIANAPPELLTLGTVFAGIAAAIPPIIWGVGLLLTPLGAVVALVVGLGALFASNFDSIKNWIDTNMPMVGAGIDAVGDAIQRFADILTGTTWERDQSSVIMGGHELPQSPYPNLVEQEKSFGQRVQEAFAATGEQMILGLQWAFIGVRSWIETTGVSEFDRIVGGIVNGLAGAFGSSGDDGNSTPVTEAIQGLLDGGISGAVSGVGDWVNQNIPTISAGFTALITNVSKWIETDGATTLGYALGTIAAALGTLLGNIIGGIGEGSGGFVQNFMSGFATGIENALTSFDVTAGIDKALTIIVGTIATLLGAKFLLGRLFASVGTGLIGGIASAATTAITTVGGALLANPVVAGIAAALAIWTGLTAEDQLNFQAFVINNVMNPISQALVGATMDQETWNRTVEDGAYEIAAFIARLFGNQDLSDRIIEMVSTDPAVEQSGRDIAIAYLAQIKGGMATEIAGTDLNAEALEIVGLFNTVSVFGADSPEGMNAVNILVNDYGFSFDQGNMGTALEGLSTEAQSAIDALAGTISPTVPPLFNVETSVQESSGKIVDIANKMRSHVVEQVSLTGQGVNEKSVFLKDTFTSMETSIVGNINIITGAILTAGVVWQAGFWMINDGIKIPISNIVTQMNSLKNAANDALAAIGAASSAPMPTLPAAGGSGGDGSSGKGVGAKIYITSNNPERIFSQTRSTGVDLVNKPVNSKISVWGG